MDAFSKGAQVHLGGTDCFGCDRFIHAQREIRFESEGSLTLLILEFRG